jgi:hypothetical protein
MEVEAMNAPLVVAGSLAIVAAAVHGGAGEVLVIRKLSTERLAGSPFGGPRMTKAMIHVTWHMTTVAFLTAGSSLLLAGAVFDGDTAQAVAVVAAAAMTAFAALAAGLGIAYMRSPRSLLRHPAPAILTLTAVLAWLGAL